jgi:peptidyl-prolyl cis-trans isomerase SurA
MPHMSLSIRNPRTPALRFAAAVLAVLASCVSAACRSTPAPPAPEPAVSPDTWAIVDGRTITREDVEKAYRRATDVSQELSDEEAATAKLSLLDDLITQDILLAKAREAKVELAESELEAGHAEARKNIPEEAFQQELTKRQLTAADMREGLRRQLLAQKVIQQQALAKVAVSDQEVTDFFNANRAQFNLAEDSYRIAQIVITPVREAQIANRTGDDATTIQAAATKVGMVMERLKGGAAFSELAMDFSEDLQTAPRGGDLGLVPLSTLKQAPPPLRDAVLTSKPGTVKVVSAGGAHSIVLVVAQEKAGQRDLSMPAVKASISDLLKGRREQLLRAAYITAAREDAEVVNYLARRLVESQGKLPGSSAAAPAGK